MQPELKTLQSLQLQGIRTRTRNADEQNALTAQIPALWQQFYQAFAQRQLGWAGDAPAVYGVYNSYESDMNGAFDVTAAVPASAHPPAELHSIHIAPGDYLVFTGHGPMPQTVIDLWGQVWSYFSQTDSACQRAYNTDFEEYSGPQDVAIYIGVLR